MSKRGTRSFDKPWDSAGSKNRNAKLTEQQVEQIIAEYRSGKRGRDNAHRYGIAATYYNQIGARHRWKHAGEPQE